MKTKYSYYKDQQAFYRVKDNDTYEYWFCPRSGFDIHQWSKATWSPTTRRPIEWSSASRVGFDNGSITPTTKFEMLVVCGAEILKGCE